MLAKRFVEAHHLSSIRGPGFGGIIDAWMAEVLGERCRSSYQLFWTFAGLALVSYRMNYTGWMFGVFSLSSKSRSLGEKGVCYHDRGIGNGSDGLGFLWESDFF